MNKQERTNSTVNNVSTEETPHEDSFVHIVMNYIKED